MLELAERSCQITYACGPERWVGQTTRNPGETCLAFRADSIHVPLRVRELRHQIATSVRQARRKRSALVRWILPRIRLQVRAERPSNRRLLRTRIVPRRGLCPSHLLPLPFTAACESCCLPRRTPMASVSSLNVLRQSLACGSRGPDAGVYSHPRLSNILLSTKKCRHRPHSRIRHMVRLKAPRCGGLKLQAIVPIGPNSIVTRFPTRLNAAGTRRISGSRYPPDRVIENICRRVVRSGAHLCWTIKALPGRTSVGESATPNFYGFSCALQHVGHPARPSAFGSCAHAEAPKNHSVSRRCPDNPSLSCTRCARSIRP